MKMLDLNRLNNDFAPKNPLNHETLVAPTPDHVATPYNMGVYGLPWTQAIKIWHFELTQDNLHIGDSEG